jgi:hypothetical protein
MGLYCGWCLLWYTNRLTRAVKSVPDSHLAVRAGSCQESCHVTSSENKASREHLEKFCTLHADMVYIFNDPSRSYGVDPPVTPGEY